MRYPFASVQLADMHELINEVVDIHLSQLRVEQRVSALLVLLLVHLGASEQFAPKAACR